MFGQARGARLQWRNERGQFGVRPGSKSKNCFYC
jgi:hypothetical protein